MYIRVFDLIGPLHIVDVHADLVVEFGRQLGGVGFDFWENNPSPELPVLQQQHGLVDHLLFCRDWLQFVQVHTLTHTHKQRSAQLITSNQTDVEQDVNIIGSPKSARELSGLCPRKKLQADLHEAGDAHDCLVGLIEHLPPGEDAARRLGVVYFLGQEVGDVSHGPVSV